MKKKKPSIFAKLDGCNNFFEKKENSQLIQFEEKKKKPSRRNFVPCVHVKPRKQGHGELLTFGVRFLSFEKEIS